MRNIWVIGLLLLIQSCVHSRFVEPLDKGDLSVGASFGGPAIEFGGAPIPVPITSIEVGYGIDSNFTVFGGWHTTAALFGNFQMDAGITYQMLEQKKYVPNVSVSPSFNYVVSVDSKEQRFWPILDLNAFWNYGKRSNYWYVGFNNYFELRNEVANEQDQLHHWIFSPQIGHIVKGKNHPWRFTAEIKLIAPNINSDKSFVPYTGILGEWGSTGLYLGFSYPIKRKK
jgi:hypothetical protein